MATTQTVQIQGLAGVLKTLQELPQEITSKRGGIVRAAMRKAAVLMQQEEKAALRRVIEQPNLGGEDRSTGLLEQNIVVTRGRPPSGQNGERYRVRIRNVAYPKSSEKSKVVTTAQVARLLEYGSEKVAPHPFIRPAFEAKKQAATDLFVQETLKGITRAQKKLERLNRVKT